MKREKTGSDRAAADRSGAGAADAVEAASGAANGFETGELDELSINALRFLAVDAVERAGSGHPGMPMGAAPMAYVLWQRHLRHNPRDPEWADRDRFVLSAGHGSMLLYGLLHLTGYEAMTLDQIKNFRQWGSITPGHPESFLTPGVETTTGPLGQGFANGVGMALAERHLAARFNTSGFPVVDHFTYGICSDGDLMEGISHEAASLAGHLGLSKLVYLYDDNGISIDGPTDLAFTEEVGARFAAYGWHVERVADGTDLAAIDGAIRAAKAETDRPSLIAVRTEIGYGSPGKEGTASAHGAPLGEEEVAAAKRALGWSAEKAFFVPEVVYAHMGQAVERGAKAQAAWEDLFVRYEGEHSDKARAFAAWHAGERPEGGWEEALPVFEAGTKMATRKASGSVLEALGPHLPQLLGGSADLTPSNKTEITGRTDFQRERPEGQYVRFGVREHAMAGAANGMALHGGLRPYVATFLIFSDYLRPALRLSALMRAPVIYVFTHDSVGLGEDGPTHQPIEQLAGLRAIPNLTVIRPADASEAAEAWRAALHNTEGPTALILTRQAVPTFDRTRHAPAEGLHRGAYVLSVDGDDEGVPDVILLGTGSEVQHAVMAAERLRAEDELAVWVVSMPSWELFDTQPDAYRRAVLPPEVEARVAIEAGATQGWARYVGPAGRTVGLDRFGASAPGPVNMEQFGFTADHLVRQVRDMLE